MLNIFKDYYNPFSFWRTPIKKIKYFFKQIKWARQRITRGFCDADIWDMDVYYSCLLHDTLLHFRNNNHSYPGHGKWETSEQWDAYLDNMIRHFALSAESNPLYEIQDETNYLFLENRNHKIRDEELKKGLEMLGECYWHLWD